MKRQNNTNSITIIGEGETEWFYFESLRLAHQYPFKIEPGFPQHADISHFIKLAKDKVREEYGHVVCLVDMDRLLRVPAEMNIYRQAKASMTSEQFIFVETNPCTEFWFLLHFLPNLSVKRYTSYEELEPELRKYMPGYEKTKRYFRRTNIYLYLTANGNLETARKNAEKLCELSQKNPEDAIAYSEVHKIFKLLEDIEATYSQEKKNSD